MIITACHNVVHRWAREVDRREEMVRFGPYLPHWSLLTPVGGVKVTEQDARRLPILRGEDRDNFRGEGSQGSTSVRNSCALNDVRAYHLWSAWCSARRTLDPFNYQPVPTRQDRPSKPDGLTKQTYSTHVYTNANEPRKWHIVAYFCVSSQSPRCLSADVCRDRVMTTNASQ